MLTFPMPTCSEVKRELEALALDQLAFRELTLVKLHLADCRRCRSAARDVRNLVARIRRLDAGRSASGRRSLLLHAALAAGVVLVAFQLFRPRPAESGDLRVAGTSSRTLALLVDRQGFDGAWRARGDDGDSAVTVGLSGLATLVCLDAAVLDANALGAAARGSLFLRNVVEAGGLRDDDAPVDVRLRAQAAIAWALRAAATRWPDYRAVANDAQRALMQMRDTLVASDGKDRLDAMTAELVSAAFPERSRVGSGREPAGLAARLVGENLAAIAPGPFSEP